MHKSRFLRTKVKDTASLCFHWFSIFALYPHTVHFELAAPVDLKTTILKILHFFCQSSCCEHDSKLLCKIAIYKAHMHIVSSTQLQQYLKSYMTTLILLLLQSTTVNRHLRLLTYRYFTWATRTLKHLLHSQYENNETLLLCFTSLLQ